MRAQLDQVFAIDTCFCTPAHSNQSQKSQESHGHHLKVGSQSSPGTSLASPTPSLCVTPTDWLPPPWLLTSLLSTLVYFLFSLLLPPCLRLPFQLHPGLRSSPPGLRSPWLPPSWLLTSLLSTLVYFLSSLLLPPCLRLPFQLRPGLRSSPPGPRSA